ncbi:MAG TPA: hypothetical protein VLA68_04365 [Nitrososphaera sp.]|nr:hypothetical protein [Nitrososphaera sp.]
MGRARIGDAAVQKRTGKSWNQWFSILESAGAKKMSHKDMASYLYVKHHVSGWWSQMIAVTYEQERGLRNVHQKADGYAVSASRTVGIPVSALYRHWSDPKLRRKWLREELSVRNETKNKSMRITWADGKTNVEVYFYGKGRSKSQVSVQHTKLADEKQVRLMRSHWKRRLDRLSEKL